ncbi:sodium/glutamate symporter [Diaphorobacter ruginosibacter]|uniref:sodium/glutamate symporter n=1 Tax=Diaphorobacter ruginosibacter TaxID=1715720 RepID=UPI00333ED0B6
MTLPEQWIVPALQSFTLAIVLFFVGRWLGSHFPILRRYSIPEPVVGGFLCALAVGVAYFALGIRIEFRLPFRDVLLLYFFAGIGLNADIQTLIKGGRPLVILLALSAVYIVLQNVLGMSVAGLFGMDPRAGLMTGSVSLTGGVGTTLAWAPTFVDRLGIDSAMELGMASNMVGLISACVVGGPIASFLMKRHGVRGDQATPLDVGMAKEAEHARLDYFGVLTAWMWLNVALILGEVFTPLFHRAGLHLPDFVGCLVAGIFLRNTVGLWLLTRGGDGAAARHWRDMAPGLALISDLCLSMFLTMALMGLQLWVLHGALAFIFTVLSLQILMAVAYSIWVVFRFSGRDYEAAVISAGFGGIALGSTATAIANMTAVTQQHGAAHRAFIIVPLVCGFFIDVVNALVIQTMLR